MSEGKIQICPVCGHLMKLNPRVDIPLRHSERFTCPMCKTSVYVTRDDDQSVVTR